jgi:GNAT superfamily N-acetyltransferase
MLKPSVPVQSEEHFPFSDLTLARRLERAEAHSNASFVEARARYFPESDARWIEVAGAYAMFDGPSSPLTQTFGLGLFEKVTAAELERVEEFFQGRGAPVFHEVSPLADPELTALLNARGYKPVEFTSVMYRPIRIDLTLKASRNDRIRVRMVRESEQELWAKTAAAGWSEYTDLGDFMLEIGRISVGRADAIAFLAELNEKPIATGALSIFKGVGLLAGASTVPEARKQGAQLSLLDARLRYAAEQGCDIAMICALPGSASQRNAERHGFRIAYTRAKWRLDE